MITISVKGLRIVARLLSVGTSAVFDHLSRARTEPLAGRGPILKQRFDIAHPSVAIGSSRGRSPGTLEVEPDDSESLGSSSTSGPSDGCCASEAVHRDHRITLTSTSTASVLPLRFIVVSCPSRATIRRADHFSQGVERRRFRKSGEQHRLALGGVDDRLVLRCRQLAGFQVSTVLSDENAEIRN